MHHHHHPTSTGSCRKAHFPITIFLLWEGFTGSLEVEPRHRQRLYITCPQKRPLSYPLTGHRSTPVPARQGRRAVSSALSVEKLPDQRKTRLVRIRHWHKSVPTDHLATLPSCSFFVLFLTLQLFYKAPVVHIFSSACSLGTFCFDPPPWCARYRCLKVIFCVLKLLL